MRWWCACWRSSWASHWSRRRGPLPQPLSPLAEGLVTMSKRGGLPKPCVRRRRTGIRSDAPRPIGEAEVWRPILTTAAYPARLHSRCNLCNLCRIPVCRFPSSAPRRCLVPVPQEVEMLTAPLPSQIDAPQRSAMPAHCEALKYRYYALRVAEVGPHGFPWR
jgi:hypothetical protein